MRLTILIPVVLWLWQVTSQDSDNSTLPSNMTAPGNLTAPIPIVTQVPNVLNPINNPVWNGSSTNESVSLQQAEQFLWGSHNSAVPFTLLMSKC